MNLDSGWKHYHHPGDSEQPIQAGPLGNTLHARISSLESVNDSTSPLLFSSTSSLTFAPTPDSPKDQLPPSPTSSTNIQTSFNTCINTNSQHDKAQSPELFSPSPTNQNKWPSPPPLPQRSPRIRRRHKLHNYASLASTNRSLEERSSVGAPPLNSSTPSKEV